MLDQLLPLLEQNYRFSARGLKLLGGYYNHVYVTADGVHVVKLFRFDRDDPRRVLSELHWMRHLHEHGVPVASPIAARNGEWIARLNEGYFVSVTTKLEGKAIDPKDELVWNDSFFHRWGATMGRIHSAGKDYKSLQDEELPDWSDETIVRIVDRSASNTLVDTELDADVAAKWSEAVERLRGFQRDEARFGLIHHDMHLDNLMLCNHGLAVLDFGDSLQHWYVYDAAIAVFFAALTIDSQEQQARSEFAARFLHSFAEGYESVHVLPAEEWRHIPFFLWYRQLYSYLYHHIHKPPHQRTERETVILNLMRERIIHEVPVVQLPR